ncbi:MAG: tRNA preQ1(34) S-adenosylmethionine ribosyltransferase-isomerase QueA [Candidatus Aminicenantes bacterium]|nr:tRNA preQ1(34) S-adenosylmethionine ribosyltransferase-isomerase QueA [Candidatus Aminicenantes bacterium]
MLVSDFDYDLPPGLIAQHPLTDRQESRMMILNRKTGSINHSVFTEFPNLLDPGDILVLNSTRVIPARIWGKTDAGSDVEFLFLAEAEPNTWDVLCRPAKKLRTGNLIFFPEGLKGRVVKTGNEGHRRLFFPSGDVRNVLEKSGYAPLPPYIKRHKKDEKMRGFDLERYQTVYARDEAAIAAPTAGLHFTPSILETVRQKGITIVTINLQVGLATFQPVRTERTENHVMLEEGYSISRNTARILNRTRQEKHPLVAVGTTTVRALESAFQDGRIRSGSRKTRLFISPGYTFRVIDRLLTNFHLPRSTLLMLVSALAGREFILKAYREAVRKKYRFYSYGDCMFIR